MKKYLREIELAGMIMVIIGVACSFFASYTVAVWPCAVGLFLWLITFLYRAFNWKEYERENKQNIIILVIAIFFLLFQMMRRI
ncbi:MAG: hypothetical protein IJP74_04495 [Prevotella sp.]|nr:hypothetical protein [Prevotella sp.]